ncbi:MAG TPA: zf-HC2 domain-containing protein [Thermoanaerobaculia bacterium]|nr:zf-HC2 domain-containing protein [Thermoanaerobaculia bacterium]
MNRHLDADLASAYLDRRLTLPERRGLDLHLEDCGDCRGRLASLRRTVARVASLERQAPPADLALDVRFRIAAEAGRGPRRSLRSLVPLFSLRPLGAAIATALAFVGVVTLRDLELGGRARALALRPPHGVVSVVEGGPTFPAPTTSEVAGRTFVWNDNIWVEKGLEGDHPLRKVHAASPAGRRLLARYHDLGYLISDGARVVLRDRRDTLELWSGG